MQHRHPPEDPVAFIRRCVTYGQIRWTYHVTIWLRQRALRGEMLVEGVSSLEVIESYPDDKYLPSFLVRGEFKGLIFHAQIATDVDAENIRVVTRYVPDREEWDEECRIRKSPG